VVGLVGDLAFLHDLSALVRPASAGDGGFASGHRCGVVVIDNGGGGIFSYLPQAGTVERGRFEQLFGTPQASDVAALAQAAGCGVTEVSGAARLDSALEQFFGGVAAGSSAVLVCHTDRGRGVAVHDELNDAVVNALGL
jgi:2-succinyl-5-enolpyruvyl-6-hydroxy-3-cyclohexene-1-carboxylate synthase